MAKLSFSTCGQISLVAYGYKAICKDSYYAALFVCVFWRVCSQLLSLKKLPVPYKEQMSLNKDESKSPQAGTKQHH